MTNRIGKDSFDRFSAGFTIPNNTFTLRNINTTPAQNNQNESTSIPKNAEPSANQTVMTVPSSTVEKPPSLSGPLTQDTVVFENTQNAKPQESKPLGKKVLYSMLAVAAAALLLTKGISGNTANKLKSLADKMENYFLKKASKNNVVANVVDSGIVYTSKTARKIFSLSNAAANFTSVKDTGFRKLYSLNYLKFKNPDAARFPSLAKGWNYICNIPKRFFDFATKNILKITEAAIDSRYQKVAKSTDNFVARYIKFVEKSNLSPLQKAEEIREAKKLYSLYNEGFSKATRNDRLNRLYESLSNIKENVSAAIVYPFKGITDKSIPLKERLSRVRERFGQVYSSYITAAQAKAAKMKHQDVITRAKVAFSNDIGDVTKSLQNLSNELKHCFDLKDRNSRLILGDILPKIEQYGNLTGSGQRAARELLKDEIITSLDSIMRKVPYYVKKVDKDGKSIRYTAEEIRNMVNLTNSLKQTLTEYNKKGQVQELLSRAKKFLPEKEYRKLKLRGEQLNATLNKAVEAEGDKMCDKIAESIVGSIPTDLVVLGSTAATGAYAISSGKDKNEKIGATLKVGVPLMGTIGMYFYSASRALSGTTNLLLSAASGLILNRIGSSIYDYYQKRYVEKKPVNVIAKEAINKATNA